MHRHDAASPDPLRPCRHGEVAHGDERDELTCDVSRLGDGDLDTLDALARLQLAAHRHGCAVVLRGASPQLRALLCWTGLCDVLPVEPSDGDVGS